MKSFFYIWNSNKHHCISWYYWWRTLAKSESVFRFTVCYHRVGLFVDVQAVKNGLLINWYCVAQINTTEILTGHLAPAGLDFGINHIKFKFSLCNFQFYWPLNLMNFKISHKYDQLMPSELNSQGAHFKFNTLIKNSILISWLENLN